MKNEMSSYFALVEKIPIYYPQSEPDDYYTTENAQHFNCNISYPNYHLDMINAKEAWEITTGSPDVVISVIDMYFNRGHEDFENADESKQFVNPEGPSHDPNLTANHGSWVAGVIAAATNNGKGISAIGYDCKMRFHDNGTNNVSSIKDALESAIINGDKVINYSSASGYSSEAYEQMFYEAYEAGIVVVASAGNGEVIGAGCYSDGCKGTESLYPASYDGVISISGSGATDEFENNIRNVNCNKSLALYQRNDHVDLVAPAFKIVTTDGLSGGYRAYSGTSFSAPMVSGTVGLMLSVNPDLTPDKVKEILKYTSDDIYGNNPKRYNLTGVSISNYNDRLEESEEIESWLISPEISNPNIAEARLSFYKQNSSESTNFDLLNSFDENIEVVYSNDYDGTGDPSNSTWNEFYPEVEIVDGFYNYRAYFDNLNSNEFYLAVKYSGSNAKESAYMLNSIVVFDGTGDKLIENLDFNNWSVYNTVKPASGYNKLTWRFGQSLKLFGTGRLNAGEAVKMAEKYIGLNIELVETSDACSYNEGSATISVTGGENQPYTLRWHNVTTGQYFGTGTSKNNLTGGNYEVTITDGNGDELCPVKFYIDNTLNIESIDYPNGLTINNPNTSIEDLNGDGRIIVRGPIMIEKKTNYLISNKTIEFIKHPDFENHPFQNYKSSGIIVKEDANLEVRGCTFRGLDGCNGMWHGISVWGEEPIKVVSTDTPSERNRTSPQDPSRRTQNAERRGAEERNSLIAGMNIKNGKLDIANSTIRDAYTGILLNRATIKNIAEQKEYGRGEVDANNVTFLNNRGAITFMAFSLVKNNSKINNCTFIQDAPLLEELSSFTPGEINSFIHLRNVENPEITANTFKGYTGFDPDKRGTAIVSYDASYTVKSAPVGVLGDLTPNTFTDLSKGIDIYATGGSTSIKIKDNRFDNVYQGITANGSNFDEVSFNRFDVPLGEENFNSWGMFMQTSAGFLATENRIEANTANEFTYGTVARNITNVNGEFYKNNYEGAFSVATQAEGTSNNRLTIDCNRYNSTNTYDWYIQSGNMANQGECLAQDPDLAATNLFSECAEAESQILSVTEFEYSSLPEYMPECISDGVETDPCVLPDEDFNELCPQKVEKEDPSCVICPTDLPPGVVLPSLPSLPGPFEDIARMRLKGELYRYLAQTGRIDDLVAVLTKENLPEDRKILIPTHWQRQRYQEARHELNELPIETDADVDFHRMFDVLIGIGETERRLHEINPSEEQVIRSVAEAQNETSILAESVLAQLTNTGYIRFPEQLPLNAKSMTSSQEDDMDKAEKIKVYPNPSQSDVTVEFEEPKKVNAQLYDATGRLVRVFETSSEQSEYTIKGLSHGIYNLRLVDKDGSAENKRIIIR